MQLQSSAWGTRVVSDLADYLKRQNPKLRGFGKRHLYNMVKFYDMYSSDEFTNITNELKLPEIVQSGIAQLGMSHEPKEMRVHHSDTPSYI